MYSSKNNVGRFVSTSADGPGINDAFVVARNAEVAFVVERNE